jgi:tetratricopeptide (TPR) repeat protein
MLYVTIKINFKQMKRLLMLMLAVTISLAAIAQSKNVNRANTAFMKKEYAEAIAFIEPALEDEKTKDKGRTWHIRAQIYAEIATSEYDSVRAIDPDAMMKAVNSYNKVLELEKEGSNYHGLATINVNQLTGSVMNKGVEAFQNDDFETALAAFDQYSLIVPEDTTGFIYAALMAQQLDRYEDVVKYYEGAFNLDYYSKAGLNAVIYFELNKLDNAEKAMEYAKLAMDKYPDDNDFRKTAVDILIKMDKMDDAIASLKIALEKEPENSRLYTNLGLLYDSQERFDEAVEQYEKALSLNPAERFALINLAVFYIGQGDKINKTAIEMDVATYRKEGEKVETAAKLEWGKSLPFLQKVLEADENDELALQNLHAVYFKLKDYESAKKIEVRRRALGYIVDDN